VANKQSLVYVRPETRELGRSATCCLFGESDQMTCPHEVFYVKLVVSSNKISDFFALFKVPNSGDTVELYLNKVLSSSLQPDYKVFVHLIQHKQTEVLEVIV